MTDDFERAVAWIGENRPDLLEKFVALRTEDGVWEDAYPNATREARKNRARGVWTTYQMRVNGRFALFYAVLKGGKGGKNENRSGNVGRRNHNRMPDDLEQERTGSA